MTLITTCFFVSIFAGTFGTLVGLGGGVILIPFLTLVMDIPLPTAIALSLLSVVATSNSAATRFLKQGLVRVPVASFLEFGTVIGAIVGVFLSGILPVSLLFLLFGIFLLFSAYQMLKTRFEVIARHNHPLAEKLALSEDHEKLEMVPQAWLVMVFAGILSSVLGIGAGVFKVLAMDQMLKLPLKVSTATSNFMIGMTASASSLIFLLQGKIPLVLGGAISVGMFLGAFFGSHLVTRISTAGLRKIFTFVLVLIGLQMMIRGLSASF
jgi:uncharacterized membrane protein YfcA